MMPNSLFVVITIIFNLIIKCIRIKPLSRYSIPIPWEQSGLSHIAKADKLSCQTLKPDSQSPVRRHTVFENLQVVAELLRI